MQGFYRVLVKNRGSDNWGAAGASGSGELAASYQGGGMRLADLESAREFEDVVKFYGIRGLDVAETKVVEV